MRADQFGVGIQCQPGAEHEGTLPRTWMRQCQIRIVADDAVEVDDVKVERTRSPMVGAHAAMRGFDALQSGQQFGCGQLGVDGNDRIAEVGCSRWHAPCVGAI